MPSRWSFSQVWIFHPLMSNQSSRFHWLVAMFEQDGEHCKTRTSQIGVSKSSLECISYKNKGLQEEQLSNQVQDIWMKRRVVNRLVWSYNITSTFRSWNICPGVSGNKNQRKQLHSLFSFFNVFLKRFVLFKMNKTFHHFLKSVRLKRKTTDNKTINTLWGVQA